MHQLGHTVGGEKRHHTNNVAAMKRRCNLLSLCDVVISVSQAHCGSHSKRRRHDSEQSVSNGTTGLEYTDLEAAEVLVCMSSWGQGHYLGGNRPTPCKPRPLTPASDSCDSILPPELPEPPKDFVSLSSLVSGYYVTFM